MKLASYPSRRTGPAHVRDCGCDALPWRDCGCHAWDAGLSLDRVIERAQLDMTQYPDEPATENLPPVSTIASTPPERPPLNVLMVLARCRKVAAYNLYDGGKRARAARKLIAEIDAIAQGGLPA
jgi:hypothetical protein